MARRTKEEAQKTRERILDAAVEVFHERGVATPSLTDVAKLANVTRGAVYGHFQNKSDMYSALCDRINLPLEAACTANSDSCKNPLGALRDGWIGFFQATAADPQQRKILSIIVHRSELLEKNGLILQRIRDGRKEGLANMARLLRNAVAQGQLPPDLKVDQALTFFHGTVAGFLSDWLFEPTAFDLATVSVSIVDALIDTLRLSPALRLQQSRQSVLSG